MAKIVHSVVYGLISGLVTQKTINVTPHKDEEVVLSRLYFEHTPQDLTLGLEVNNDGTTRMFPIHDSKADVTSEEWIPKAYHINAEAVEVSFEGESRIRNLFILRNKKDGDELIDDASIPETELKI